MTLKLIVTLRLMLLTYTHARTVSEGQHDEGVGFLTVPVP